MPSQSELELFLDPPSLSPEIKEVSLGQALTIVSSPFAPPTDNIQLRQMALRSGLPPEQIPAARQIIAATGFTHRYAYWSPENPPDLEATIDRTTTIGAILLRQVLASRNWKKPDVFIDTSAFLPPSINSQVLAKAGIDPHEVTQRSYRLACAGAAGAFIDCLADHQLTDKRIVIAALEPLSYLIHKQHLNTLSGLPIAAIFGDDYAAIGFTPNHFELMAKQIWVQPDGGVIKIPTAYDFQGAVHNPNSIPNHYVINDGGERIFKYSPRGAFLNISTPPENIPTMDGLGTARFFGDITARLILYLLETTHNPHLLSQLDQKNTVLHPASDSVIHRVARELIKAGAILTRELPWIMNLIGRSNSSSATILVNWQHMIELGMIDPKLPVVLAAPGVGSVIAGAIMNIHPDPC
jgi:hypothetical protein